MIQIIISPSEGLLLGQQAAAAIDAGARWLELNLTDTADSEAVVADIKENIIPLCRERGVIMTVRDNAGLAEATGVHGVHIADKSLNAILMRNNLGAEAIIGIDIADAQAALTMQNNDIDYVRISADIDDDCAARLIADIRSAGAVIPVVRQLAADTAENVQRAMSDGFSGVTATDAVMCTPDAGDTVRNLFAALP